MDDVWTKKVEDMTPEERKKTGNGNLIPFHMRTEEDQWRIRSMAGKASVQARRCRKTQAEILRAVMALEMEAGEARDMLAKAGLDTDWITDANVAVMRRARAGDVEAIRYIRDTVGEKPRDGLEIGNLDDKPLATMDLSKMSDEQLKAMLVKAQENAEKE